MEILEKKTTKTVLFAPLDWGLGHATRCIPIIKAFQRYNFNIIIASNGAVKTLLKVEFPEALFVDIPNYNVQYSSNGKWFLLKMLSQAPSISLTIKKERRWLQRFLEKNTVHLIISDNRLGFYSNTVPSIYITHQIHILTGNRITDAIASKIHQNIIKNYTQCWIPDFGGEKNLSGKLSHPPKTKVKTAYIGCLSRFYEMKRPIKHQVLAVLSGPEPQRTILEKMLITQVVNCNVKIVLVRGLPNKANLISDFPLNISVYNYLQANELNTLIAESELIICRSGYTSIMDLVKLKKKAVLIPTPGQTEQEYLAKYLLNQQLFPCIMQHEFTLNKAFEMAANFNYHQHSWDMELYKMYVDELVQKL